MPVFSNIVASVAPELFAGSSARDAEALLSHLSGTCFVQCSVRADGCYEIQGSWAAIQDVYIALCANTSNTVELVQSLVQAAKYVSVNPPKDKSCSIATQTDPALEPIDISPKPELTTTVDKATETTDVLLLSLPKNESDTSDPVEIKLEEFGEEKGECEIELDADEKEDDDDEEEEREAPVTRGTKRKRPVVKKKGRKKTFSAKKKTKVTVKAPKNLKTNAPKAKPKKSVLATAGQVSDNELEETNLADGKDGEPLEDPSWTENVELKKAVKKRRKGIKFRSFQPEFSESPKKFIYMPDQLDNPEVQDLDVEEQTASGTGASNETIDTGEKKSPVKLREFSAEDIELDKMRENELMTECLNLAKDSVIKCTLCSYQVDNKDSFREHLRRRHLDKRHMCDICGAAFGMHNDLLKHKRRSHIHKHYCGICSKVYRTVRLVKEHVLTHIGINQAPKLFMCQDCGKTYQSSTGLNNHQKIEHSGMERPFVCMTCGQRFWQKCHLKEHEVNHTGKRPYMCAVCGETFVYRTCLREHKKRHSNARDYACELCGKAFKVMAGLRGHMKRHDESSYISCDVCNKRFATKSALERHSRTHTGEKPYACDDCGQCFNDSSILRRHRLAKHPGSDPNYHSLRRRTGAGSHGVFKQHPPGGTIPLAGHSNPQPEKQQQEQPLLQQHSTAVTGQPQAGSAELSAVASTSQPITTAPSSVTEQQIQAVASQAMTNIIQKTADSDAQQVPVTLYNMPLTL